MERIISLTTDFGTGDSYVGTMKGVILSINPRATVVDITHGISPQNILKGTFLLSQAYPYFPEGTIHCVVVDPGVGGNRRPILIETDRYLFVGPDNGVFTCVLERERVRRIIHITRKEYFLKKVSKTFHGRDVFAPVAAHLSLGINPENMGEPIDNPARISIPRPVKGDRGITGEVLYIDSFGNCITNISEDEIKDFKDLMIRVKGCIVRGLSETYEEGERGVPIALIGSTSLLEIGCYMENASRLLDIKEGDRVEVIPV